MRVRAAAPGDIPAILALVRALAAYEREPDAVCATEASLHATLFGPAPQVFAHVAEAEGVVVGAAIWFLNYSTWTGRPGLFLEDLFVAEAGRRRGVARALFAALAEEAQASGCARIDWAVLDWNEAAMDFYRAIGGRRQGGWQPWRLDEAGIAALAEEARA